MPVMPVSKILMLKYLSCMAPFGSPAPRVVSPTALTGRPVSFAEPLRDAFRACGLGLMGNGMGYMLQSGYR